MFFNYAYREVSSLAKAKFFATVSPGIEDIACEEVSDLLGCEATPDIGKIFFEGELESIYVLNLKSSILNRIMIQLCRETFSDLDDLYRLVKDLDYGWIIDADQSFAVRSERVGTHDFTSVDVSRVVGQAIIDSYREAHGRRLKVNLDEPDVEFYALVRDQEFLLGVNTSGSSLHRRGYKVYMHPAALKPTIASAMLRIGGWRAGKSLIDPMCGGGTIPIEAALKATGIPPGYLRKDFAFLKLKIFTEDDFWDFRSKILSRKAIEHITEIYGMEKFKQHLEGAMKNSEKAGVREAIEFKLGDATKSVEYPEGEFDLVVVNPPYGIRMIPGGSPKRLYSGFLKALKDRAEGAVLVLITAAHKRFKEATEENSVEVLEKRIILHGDLRARIFKCKI